MDIEKAENIIDKMYQNKMNIREKQTKEGIEVDLSKNVTFTELEEASIILLRNYLILKRKNEEKDKQIDLMAEYTFNKNKAQLIIEYGIENKEQLIKEFEKQANEKGGIV